MAEKASQLNRAKGQALQRAKKEKCRAIFNNQLPSIQNVAFKPGWMVNEDPKENLAPAQPALCHDGKHRFAYTWVRGDGKAITGGKHFVVYLCEAFYNRTERAMSSTVLHEWAHLAGNTHESLAGKGADAAAMTRKIDSLC